MKNGQSNQHNALVSFQRFERAVKHIIGVPKQKVLDMEKANGSSRSNKISKGKNGSNRR